MDILIFSSLKEISQSLSDSFFKNQICSKSKKRFLEKEIAKEILLRSLQVFYGYTSSILPEIKLNKYGKPYFKDNFYPFYNISHSEDFILKKNTILSKNRISHMIFSIQFGFLLNL